MKASWSSAAGQEATSRQPRYAFVFDSPRESGGEPRTGFEEDVVLTPLDAMYLARLCALDSGQQQPFQQDADAADSAATCPPHLLTSDEVLVLLLGEGVHVPEPRTNGLEKNKAPERTEVRNNGKRIASRHEGKHNGPVPPFTSDAST